MALSRTRLLMMGVGDAATCHQLTCRSRVIRAAVGDPGFLSALKSIGGAALSFVPGGGAVSASLRAAGSALSRPKAPSTAPFVPYRPPMVMAPQPTLINRALNLLPNITPAQARAGGLGIAGAALGALGIGAAVAPRVTKDGRITHRRRHRMRVTNIKALGRSTRRLAGFHKLAQHVEAQLSHLVRRRARGRRFPRKK